MDSVTPLCYTQLFGQEKAKKLLDRALVMNRIPHGLIFRGPQGVGKSLFGKGVAAAINCKDINRVGACGVCASCKKFRSDNHPDFVTISPEKGVIKIDRIRQLGREISFAPYESAMRVIVLEDVQTMRREAANSLLKTLEEPPEGNLLILTADSSYQILSTLTSRCQVIPFAPLSQQQTMTILKQHGVTEEEAKLFARLSEGSPGQALLMHQTEMVAILKETIVFLRDTRGKEGGQEVSTLLRLAEKMASLKDDLVTLLGLFRLWIRDLIMGEKAEEMAIPGPESFADWSYEQLFAKLQAIDRAELELERNCNKNLVCEVLLFKLQ